MAHLVDSSVWVALFLDFDTEHSKAERVIRNLSGIIYVPYCVILEVSTVLAYKHSKDLANNFLAYVQDNQDFQVLNNDALEEIEFYRTIPEKLSFTDATLIFLSRKLDVALVTFDKQLEKIAKRI